MGKYLDIIRQPEPERAGYDINDINDKRYTDGLDRQRDFNPQDTFGRLCRLCRTALDVLETRCPDHVEPVRWQQAVEDGRRFLAQWGEQAGALGWTPRDLFGLHKPPDRPHPSYRRLSRYDCTGLIWQLEGRPVQALTANTAAIETTTGHVVTYRRHSVA
jgi:hypothetical protein